MYAFIYFHYTCAFIYFLTRVHLYIIILPALLYTFILHTFTSIHQVRLPLLRIPSLYIVVLLFYMCLILCVYVRLFYMCVYIPHSFLLRVWMAVAAAVGAEAGEM